MITLYHGKLMVSLSEEKFKTILKTKEEKKCPRYHLSESEDNQQG